MYHKRDLRRFSGSADIFVLVSDIIALGKPETCVGFMFVHLSDIYGNFSVLDCEILNDRLRENYLYLHVYHDACQILDLSFAG